MKSFIVLFAFVLAAPSLALCQGRFDDVEIKVTKVSGNVVMLEGAGGNLAASIGDDGVLLVDDQFKALAPKIKKALSDLGGGDLRFLLNTHFHGDHTGGNEVFGSEALILAHENVRKRLKADKPESAWPVLTFKESVTIYFNGEAVEVIHFPHGHTDGDSVVFFKNSNVVHMGDHMFSGLFPFIDLEAGGSVEGYLRNVESVLGEISEDTKIIPGHGPLSTRDDLREFAAMIRATWAVVKKGMRDGRSLEEIQKAGFEEKYKDWSWSFIPTERWIETLWKSEGGD